MPAQRKEPMKRKLLFAIAAFCLLLAPAYPQEVIMNQPSADSAPKGHIFVRADEFYTQAPSFYLENLNLAIGLADNFELSLNANNAYNRAPLAASLVAGFKYAPYKGRHLTVYVGDQFIQPLTNKSSAGFSQGNISYEAAAISVGSFRFTGGSFQSHDGVALGNRSGAIGGIEWMAKKFKNGWSIMPCIDYASGAGMNGYASPGLMFAKGNFFASPGYLIANPHNPNGAHQLFLMVGYTLTPRLRRAQY
jgi:hypothetical protein